MNGKTGNTGDRVRKIIVDRQKKGGFTHCYVAAGSFLDQKPLFEYESGTAGIRFDLASLTKALFTTPVILDEFYKGTVPADATLHEYCMSKLPGLSPETGRIPLHKLLSHNSGLPDWRAFWVRCEESGWQKMSGRECVLKRINRESSGLGQKEDFLYSDVGFILLGLAIEARKEKSGSEIFHEFYTRLNGKKAHDLSFNRTVEEQKNSASSGYCRVRNRELMGIVHDENASVFEGVCGHSGLFGTGRGLQNCLRALLSGDFGKYLLATQTEKRTGNKEMTGLGGWQQGGGLSSWPFGYGKAVGHLGFTGTSFWVIPENLTYGIVLTNRVISGRTCNWITSFRREIYSDLFKIVNQ